jgi:hypothetical protein
MKAKKKQPAQAPKKLNNFKQPAKIFIWPVLFVIFILIIFFVIYLNKNSHNKMVEKKISIYDEPRKVVEKDFLDEPMPENSEILAQGEFQNVEQILSGKALFLENANGIFLRLENFQTFNGQNIHVYLSPILNLDRSDVVDAGLLKATSGNFNYQLDKKTDITKYNNVLIWSDPYNAFFGYAALIKNNADINNQESSATSTQIEPSVSSPELY